MQQTMALDLARLLKPISADAPSGIELRYDPDFQSLQDEIEPKTDYEQVNGKEVPKQRPRDWQKLHETALELSVKGRDLRLQIILLRTSLAAEGVAAMPTGLTLLKESLDQYWEDIYPALDRDETDPLEQAFARLNALRQLTGSEGLLADLRQARIVEARGLGGLSLRDIEVASGRVTPAPGEKTPDASLIGAVFKMCEPEAIQAARLAADTAIEELKGIEEVIGNKLGDPTAVPDFEPLAAMLKAIRQEIDAHGGTPPPTSESTDAVETASVGANGHDTQAARPAAPQASGRLDSRDEVVAALDRILDYYQRREPSSPIPMVVERVKRLVPLSFMDLMEDLAPSSVKELKGV
ncbi:MAG: type VI secretion system protein TssA, partial [Pseudomonadota bacterium]